MLESQFKKRVMKDLKTFFKDAWILKTNERGRAGVPDLLICIKGAFVAIELKRNVKSEPTVLQAAEVQRIRLAGGLSFIAYPEAWPSQLAELRRQFP